MTDRLPLLPLRIRKVLKAFGIVTRADLLLREPDLLALGLTSRDVGLVRVRLGLRSAPESPAAPAPESPAAPAPFADGLTVGGPELWTTRQVADYLSLHRRTVANWCAAGRLSAIKLGDDWRVPRAEVQRLVSHEG